jgi:hypothetical protein
MFFLDRAGEKFFFEVESGVVEVGAAALGLSSSRIMYWAVVKACKREVARIGVAGRARTARELAEFAS